MKIAVVVPAHNEEPFIAILINSLRAQTRQPDQVVVVSDHSTDNTVEAARYAAQNQPNFTVIERKSSAKHEPGSKVIRAFQEGLQQVEPDFDVIVKLDADLDLPPNYFDWLETVFKNPKVGIAGGQAAIEVNGRWEVERLTDNDHVRGAFKAYSKNCFEKIGGLKAAMGWDTVDELLAKFYGFDVLVNENLIVKHLKPTGFSYNKKAAKSQGEAFYSLGYGFLLTAIASLKLALRKKKPTLLFPYLTGFLAASLSAKAKLVTAEQARFIKSYRWKKIKQKLFG